MWKWLKPAESEERFRALEQQIRDLEGRMKGIEGQWDDTYDKLRRLTGRITKTAALRDAEKEKPDESNSNSGSPSNGSILGTHERLQAARARHGVLPR